MVSVNILAPAVILVAFQFQASAPDQTMSSAVKISHAEEQILLDIVSRVRTAFKSFKRKDTNSLIKLILEKSLKTNNRLTAVVAVCALAEMTLSAAFTKHPSGLRVSCDGRRGMVVGRIVLNVLLMTQLIKLSTLFMKFSKMMKHVKGSFN